MGAVVRLVGALGEEPMRLRLSTETLVYAVGWVLLIMAVVTYQRWSNQATIDCVVKVVARDQSGTEDVRAATNARDLADYRVKYWVIDQGKPVTDRRVQKAWIDYRIQTILLQKAKAENPIPDVRKICK